jgi:uncharacterized repeat protein (TIGR02543 family)
MKPFCIKTAVNLSSVLLSLVVGAWFTHLRSGAPSDPEVPDPRQRVAEPAAVTSDAPFVAAALPSARNGVPTGRFQKHRLMEEAPVWALGFGREFWRPHDGKASAKIKPSEVAAQLPAGLNLGNVIERVRHAWESNERSGLPSVNARNYAASLDEAGLRFSPHRPAECGTGAAPVPPTSEAPLDEAAFDRMGHSPQRGRPDDGRTLRPDPRTEALFRTVSIGRDEAVFYDAAASTPEWSVLGNTAQALLNAASGLLEHYEARGEGVEVAWVLSQPLPGTGPLALEAALDGLTYVGQTKMGFHFADATGTARVRVGNVKAVDAAGQSWDVAMDTDGTRLRVKVAAAILAQATYPLAIDPTVGPEFGMDNPVMGLEPGQQYFPAVAFNGTDNLVVWEDRRSSYDGDDIYGARVSSAGVVLDPNGIAISTQRGYELTPAVAANGSDFLVVWWDTRNETSGSATNRDIYGARVTHSGIVADPQGIPICNAPGNQRYPAVTALGTNYLVVWDDQRNSETNSDIYGARVSPAGAVLEANSIAISRGTNEETRPAVAANGTDYLVVWVDAGDRVTSYFDIYGKRLSSAGVVLDTNRLVISDAGHDQYWPRLASSGTDYLVVWQDFRNNATEDGLNIYGTLVRSNGAVVSPAGVPICTARGVQFYPSVSSQGTNYLVVWEDGRNAPPTVGGLLAGTNDIYGARISGTGVVLDPDGIAISTAPDRQDNPAVAASGSGFFVVWTEKNVEVVGARVSGAGVVAEPNGLPISTLVNRERSPAVAFNGTNYLVVWEDDRNQLNRSFDIYGVRVSRASALLDASGISICIATNDQRFPRVTSLGGNYLVVWEDYRNEFPRAFTNADIYGARVNGAGVVLESNGIAISRAANDQLEPAVAANGNGYLVVWADFRSTNSDIYGARVDGAGIVLESHGIPISTAANDQLEPAVAANGISYLVVWADYRNNAPGALTNSDICGARVDGAGIVLDIPALPICTAPDYQYEPAVVANGTDYLVVWTDERSYDASGPDIYGARVRRSGTVLEPDGIAISTSMEAQERPAVASNGSGFLVVWEDNRNYSTSGADLYGAEVDRDGVLRNPDFALNTNRLRQFAAGAAYDGAGQFLVVNQDRTLGERVNGKLVGAEFALTTTAVPSGTVCRSPDQITYAFNATVKLTAMAAPGWVFSGWSGDASGASNPLPVTVTTDKNIIANFTPGPTACAIAPAGLAAWWRAEGSGNDFVGGNNGTLINGATVAAGKVRQAFSFDGVNGALVIPHSAGVDFQAGESFTFEAWVRIDGLSPAGNDALLQKWVPGVGGYSLTLAGPPEVRHLEFSILGSIYGVTALAFPNPDSNFHHLAVTLNRGTARLTTYVDGVLQHEVDSTGIGSLANNSRLWVGHQSMDAATGAHPFHGLIDELTLYDRALSAAEMPALYNAGILGKCIPPPCLEIISIARNNGNATLTWLSEFGATYRVQYKADLRTDSWTNLAGDVTATADTASKVDSTIGTAGRFYQILKLP